MGHVLNLLKGGVVASALFCFASCANGPRGMMAESAASLPVETASPADDASTVQIALVEPAAGTTVLNASTSLRLSGITNDLEGMRTSNRTGLRSRLALAPSSRPSSVNLVTTQATLTTSLEAGVTNTVTNATAPVSAVLSATDATLTPVISGTLGGLRYLPGLIPALGK